MAVIAFRDTTQAGAGICPDHLAGERRYMMAETALIEAGARDPRDLAESQLFFAAAGALVALKWAFLEWNRAPAPARFDYGYVNDAKGAAIDAALAAGLENEAAARKMCHAFMVAPE